MSRIAIGATVAAGAAATGAVSLAISMPGRDAAALAGMAAGAGLVAGAMGAAGLHALRRQSVAGQSTVIALTAVAAVVGGALLAARAMFLSHHDLGVLVVVIPAAAAAGMVVALVLGGRVGQASRELSSVARGIADGSWSPPDHLPATRELAGLARELEEMSHKLEATCRRSEALRV